MKIGDTVFVVRKTSRPMTATIIGKLTDGQFVINIFGETFHISRNRLFKDFGMANDYAFDEFTRELEELNTRAEYIKGIINSLGDYNE